MWAYSLSPLAAERQRLVARNHTYSSEGGEYESLESCQSVRVGHAKGYRPENGRALTKQVKIVLGSNYDAYNTVEEQVFYALPLIIMESLVSGSPWTVPP